MIMVRSRLARQRAGTLVHMNAFIALLAAVAGASIALAGQYMTRRGEVRTRTGEFILDQCASIIALSDDFRNRVWEEKELGLTGRVDAWDLTGYRHAAARLMVLSDDAALLSALEDLTESGKRLAGYWRRGQADPAELERRREADKEVCARFVAASAKTLRRQLGGK
jgi:hypothetical protein